MFKICGYYHQTKINNFNFYKTDVMQRLWSSISGMSSLKLISFQILTIVALDETLDVVAINIADWIAIVVVNGIAMEVSEGVAPSFVDGKACRTVFMCFN
jgi:hypothetical protein